MAGISSPAFHIRSWGQIVYISACDSPFSLEALAVQIRSSSNFQFDWQFYRLDGANAESPTIIRNALEVIIATPDLHRFLSDSFEGDERFEVKPLHEHCRVCSAEGEFENILARAAGDHLGAYSKELRDATPKEKQAIPDLFRSIGEYRGYVLMPGNVAGCPVCRDHNNHVFSNWFCAVAWDWCLLAAWPDRGLLWVGCLTDTD